MSSKAPITHSLLVASQSTDEGTPFLTIAIPHYKHRRYLEIVLDSLFAQTYRGFEILISDDCSPDDSNEVIPVALEKSDRPFRYYAQSANLGYDGNVRFCLREARGEYVFLLGNDDALAGPDVLERVAALLKQLDFPEVAFTSFGVWGSDEVVRRALSTRIVDAGPAAAIANFRSFSFVSGLIYKQSLAVTHETDRWDSSIYYQIYIACRILGAGGRLAALDVIAVRKDVEINREPVPNYASKWSKETWSFQVRHTGLDSVIRVTADAVLPFISESERSRVLRRVVAKILVSTYPYWLLEYRRVSNWSFSAGIARGLWPRKLLAEYKFAWTDRFFLWLLYLVVTAACLTSPLGLLGAFGKRLAHAVRRSQQSELSETPS